MERADGDLRWWRLPAAVLVVLYLALLAWLTAAGLNPALVTTSPRWLGWLATPGSAWAMSAAVALGAAAFGAVLASRGQGAARVPFLLSAWCAASAAPLAMAAYLPCTGDAPPFWTALTSTFSLLLGSFDAPFGAGQACAYPVPLGLQLARLLAIVATLSGATSVLFAVSRAQLDRLGVLRARRLTVVIGLDEGSWPVLQQLAARRQPGHRTAVLLSGEAGSSAERARALGALVLRATAADPLGLREVPWPKVGRCYLLAGDAGTNRSRAMALRKALAPGAGPARGRARVAVVARIDDPWHADDWRKRFIGEPGLVLDAIGTYEATAETLIGRLLALDVDQLLVTGEPPLLLALCAELSQYGRELQFLEESSRLPGLVIVDRDAAELLADHRARQQRFASDPLQVVAVDAPAGLDSVQSELDRLTASGRRVAVVIGRPGTRLGTRLAVRHPDLPVFELVAGTRPLTDDEPAAGRLQAFSLALSDATGRSADAWERAARAVHERYRRRFPQAGRAVPWEELDEFYRESNRRQLHSILDAMAALGRSWAPTRPETSAVAADPDRLGGAGEETQITAGLERFSLRPEELAAVAAREHESWRAHYLGAGWRPGAERDDQEKRHPDLRPWTDLDEATRRKTMAGVVDTLFALRALGYRSVAPTAAGWTRFTRSGEVRAERLDRPLVWEPADGGRLTGAAGDWLVSDASGGRRTVTDPSFRAGHRHLAGDRWERTGTVSARPVVPGEAVATQEGEVVAGAGSWLVRDADGNEWVVPDEHFRAGYRPLSQA